MGLSRGPFRPPGIPGVWALNRAAGILLHPNAGFIAIVISHTCIVAAYETVSAPHPHPVEGRPRGLPALGLVGPRV